MLRFGVYLIGLALVLVALWTLLVIAKVTDFVPLAIIGVVMVLLLGLGIMSGAKEVAETPREITETTQRVGGTEVRRSKME
ncbi:MAG TPA: hypothetical protein VGR28_11160 [Candidatus Thermoplasmatota archaeon]|jgi:hypothetical protein|nr:hypothetical protein [Candidatus Thermoplasmatota archaeon]